MHMNNKNHPLPGKVKEQISKTRYLIDFEDGRSAEVALSGKYVIHGVELSVGSKVFVLILENSFVTGHILSATDFKVNGWCGWTDEHEPRI